MKIAEKIQEDLRTLDPGQAILVYDLIRTLKAAPEPVAVGSAARTALRLRKTLACCKGNMSDDIAELREDRA